MTHPTEIVETVKVTEVVEDHHKPSLKERIVDTLTGHHHEKKEEKHHHDHEHKKPEAVHKFEGYVAGSDLGAAHHPVM
ncbi:hypothetical protein BGZ83_002370 [Gryganskiella cystojenkinii]|nr:hypothetical protein BGZ83_002370 [Gryganskiella cystojenkinii]